MIHVAAGSFRSIISVFQGLGLPRGDEQANKHGLKIFSPCKYCSGYRIYFCLLAFEFASRIFAQVSLSVTVRLKTSLSSDDLVSTQK